MIFRRQALKRLFSTSNLASPPTATAATTLIVYTDGACKFNGQQQAASAGIGVWFAEGDQRNVSAPLEGASQTNQRAELAAAIAALERVQADESVEIRSDSKYVVLGVSTWLRTWRGNGFHSSRGAVVANVDLWRRLDRLLLSRDSMHQLTRFVWVPAHHGVPGNEDADALASLAAEKGILRRAEVDGDVKKQIKMK
jgi:ribonuclease HI